MNNQYQNIANINVMNKQNKTTDKFKIILTAMLAVLTLLIGLIIIFSIKGNNVKTRTFMIYMVGADGAYESYTLAQLLPHRFRADTHMA